MSRIKLLFDVARDMRSLADSIQAVCDAMSSDESPEMPDKQPDVPAEQPKKAVKSKAAKNPEVTLEQVRGVLAEKSQIGFTAEVRELIRKYGADKLSGIDPKHYAAVLEDAEVLGDG